MKKLFYITGFILCFGFIGLFIFSPGENRIASQSTNIFWINPALTIAGEDTLGAGIIDTLSEFDGDANLNRFTLNFQLTIYTGADTLEVFVGTTAAFTAGQTFIVLPDIALNLAYFKRASGLNVFVRNAGINKATYYFGIVGI